jgi:hypothetical protein
MHWFEADPQEFKKEVEKRSEIEAKVLQDGKIYRL